MSEQLSDSVHPPPAESRAAGDQFFLNAALGSNQWWRWVLGLVVIILMWIGVGSIVVGIAGCAFLRATNAFGISCSDGVGITGDGSLTARLVVAGLGFVVGLVGIWGVVRLIHKKPLGRVATGRSSFDCSRYLYAMGVALIVSLVVFAVNRFILRLDMTFQEPGWEYLVFVVFALLLVPIQTGFEELFFRGYILQGIMLLVKKKVVLALVSGVIFALPHLTNPEASAYGFAPYTIALVSFGVFFGLMTLLDGGIELAAGYHAVNNLFLGLVANTDSAVIVTPSLFTIQRDAYDLFPHVSIDVLGLLLALAILNHKYKWVKLSRK